MLDCVNKPTNYDSRLSTLKWAIVDNKLISYFIIQTMKLDSINKFAQQLWNADNGQADNDFLLNRFLT